MLRLLQQELQQQRMIMTINAVNTDGTVTATSYRGSSVRVLGSGNIGDKVYVQGGLIIGSAPDLPFFEIEV